MPEPPMTICACCRDKKDGVWRFVCRCGFPGGDGERCDWLPAVRHGLEFEVEVKAA